MAIPVQGAKSTPASWTGIASSFRGEKPSYLAEVKAKVTVTHSQNGSANPASSKLSVDLYQP